MSPSRVVLCVKEKLEEVEVDDEEKKLPPTLAHEEAPACDAEGGALALAGSGARLELPPSPSSRRLRSSCCRSGKGDADEMYECYR